MITFGIPKREVVNKEKYPTLPVLTMEHVEDKGFNRRFVLNEKAIQLLQVIPGVSQVIFAFDGDGEAYISKYTSEDSVLVGKNMAFSNKKYYDHISKLYKLQSNIDNEFELTDAINVGDNLIFRMKFINPSEAIPTVPNPVVEKEIEHMVSKEENTITNDIVEWGNKTDEEILEYIGQEEPDGEVVESRKEAFLMNSF